MKLLCCELSQAVCQAHIEIPAAMMLFKILILHSVAEVQQDEGEIPQAFQASLIEILGTFLNGTLSALNKLE